MSGESGATTPAGAAELRKVPGLGDLSVPGSLSPRLALVRQVRHVGLDRSEMPVSLMVCAPGAPLARCHVAWGTRPVRVLIGRAATSPLPRTATSGVRPSRYRAGTGRLPSCRERLTSDIRSRLPVFEPVSAIARAYGSLRTANTTRSGSSDRGTCAGCAEGHRLICKLRDASQGNATTNYSATRRINRIATIIACSRGRGEITGNAGELTAGVSAAASELCTACGSGSLRSSEMMSYANPSRCRGRAAPAAGPLVVSPGSRVAATGRGRGRGQGQVTVANDCGRSHLSTLATHVASLEINATVAGDSVENAYYNAITAP